MFQNLRFKRNKRRVLKELEQYKDLELYKYTAKARLRDGTDVLFGGYYSLTESSFDNWINDILYKDTIHTDNDTYIKSCNVIEAELHKEEVVNVKYRYEDYWAERYKWNYDKEDIDIQMKEYNKLKTLSMIK